MERRRQSAEEARTQEFFDQGVNALARSLKNMVVELDGANKSIQLTTLQGWTHSEVGKRYEAMEEMDPGDLWVSEFPFRKMRQSLIVAKDRGQVGACVRIIKAASLDAKTGEYMPLLREGDTANYLGLKDDEVCQLKFADKSDVLHLVRGNRR